MKTQSVEAGDHLTLVGEDQVQDPGGAVGAGVDIGGECPDGSQRLYLVRAKTPM